MMQPKHSYSHKEAQEFYRDLLVKALLEIQEPATMVLGPMFIIRTPEENFAIFRRVQQKLQHRGEYVFDQIPFTDYVLQDAPFEYTLKFELFYKPLIQSGKITKCYVLPDSEHSQGVATEIAYAQEKGIEIEYIENVDKFI